MSGATSSRALVISEAPAVPVMTMSTGFWIARSLSGIAAFALHLAGLYAVVVIFGRWITVTLCGVGALAVFLQHVILWRATTCSSGE